MTNPTAQPRRNHNTATDQVQVVTFTVGEMHFGVDVRNVREIVRALVPTRVPHAPSDLAGVIDWRGRIIPLIDLRERFGLPRCDHASQGRIVVVETANRFFGLAVDQVSELVRIDAADSPVTSSIPAALDSACMTNMRAVDGRELILIDCQELLAIRPAASAT